MAAPEGGGQGFSSYRNLQPASTASASTSQLPGQVIAAGSEHGRSLLGGGVAGALGALVGGSSGEAIGSAFGGNGGAATWAAVGRGHNGEAPRNAELLVTLCCIDDSRSSDSDARTGSLEPRRRARLATCRAARISRGEVPAPHHLPRSSSYRDSPTKCLRKNSRIPEK